MSMKRQSLTRLELGRLKGYVQSFEKLLTCHATGVRALGPIALMQTQECIKV